MNVRNPRKRVPTAKGRQNKNISLPTEPLSGNNSIPKQHVGTDQTNQLQFDQEIDRIISPVSNQEYFDQIDFSLIPATDFYIDQNPFDLLSEDLFDNSLSEDDILDGQETNDFLVNEPNKELVNLIDEEPINEPNSEISKLTGNNLGFKEKQDDNYEEGLPQDGRSLPLCPKRIRRSVVPVADHPLLKPMAEKWLESNKWSGVTLSKKKTYINKFIKFLVHEKVQKPTSNHISLYYQSLINDPDINHHDDYMSAVRTFFRWAEDFDLYEDITKEAKAQLLRSLSKSKTRQSKATITIRDMVNAKFSCDQAAYLLDNDLTIFKQWVETMSIADPDAQKKYHVLHFAHFLHSENRTTPTQQDIIDYYEQHLRMLYYKTVNQKLLLIKHFFEWTAEETIYPDITINFYPASNKPMDTDDIPILLPKRQRKPISNPTKPLINKTI